MIERWCNNHPPTIMLTFKLINMENTITSLDNKIKKDCKRQYVNASYLDRQQSNFILDNFELVTYQTDADLPKAKNGKPYKWYCIHLESRRGVFFVNFTLKQVRTETLNEFYKGCIHPD